MKLFGKRSSFSVSKGFQTVEKNKLIESLKLFEKGKLIDTYRISEVVERPNNYDLYKDVYLQVPVVFNAVNNLANFAIQSGYELENDNGKVLEFIDKSNFDLIFLNILKQTLIYGNSYAEIIKNKLGEILTLKLLPCESMYVKTDENDEVIGYKQVLKINQSIDFSKEEIIHFKWNDSTNPFYGESELKSVLGTITRLLQHQVDIGEIIHRYAQPIIHWKIGSSEEPASQSQVDTFQALLKDRQVGEDLVTSDAVVGDPITANLKMIQPDGMLKSLENQLIAGLGVPEIFVRGGESSNKATADVELEAFDRKVKALRMAVSFKIEDELFNLITPGVKFNWNELSVTSQAEKANILQLYVNSGVPLKVALQMVGMGSWVEDVEKEKIENPPEPSNLEKKSDQIPRPKQAQSTPREQDFESQADWIDAYDKSKKITS